MRGEKNMALFVICGKQDTGKTHTTWLIYNLLNNAGTLKEFEPKGEKPLSWDEVIQHMRDSYAGIKDKNILNFRAVFDYNGKRIALISAGDFLEKDTPGWEVVSFKHCMAWAEQNEVDHVICCSRSLNKTNSVQNYILTNYRMHIYRWYYKNQMNNLNEQIADAQRIAIEIFTDIKRDC
jgi:hypothetical protein